MKPPYLKLTYNNGFDDKVTVKTTLSGNSIDILVDAIRDALKGMGFSPEQVDDYFQYVDEGTTHDD
jgi:hypothetical protein